MLGGPMNLVKYGLIHQKSEDIFEKVSFNGMDMGLMSSYDGTEVIHHKLHKNARWVIGPEDGWNALEFIYVLNGTLILSLDEGKIHLNPGDRLNAVPIKKDCFFTTDVGAEFLYITSQPIFHHYSNTIQKFKELAISVEEKDGYTVEHCSRIKSLSMIIGEQMSLSNKELYQLNIGSFLHDIGKIKIPDSVLKKPGKLDRDEWNIMKSHPSQGRIILEESNSPILLEASAIVEQHHERFDGSGYPHGMKYKDILMGSSIVAVVDSYDAMTTDRVYRKGMKKEEAFEEILKGKGTLYHPDVVESFFLIEDKII
jgi:HD-GYP domain-containing protein (c-di-GMP phosphodiesterase class II)